MVEENKTGELTVNTLARQETYQQQRKSLMLLVGFRLLIVSALLISTIVVHANAGFSSGKISNIIPLYTVCTAFFLANLFYILLFKLKASFLVQTITQMAGDLLFAAVIVHGTGGVQSAFSLFYMLVAINGAVLLQRRGALWVASAAVICYLTQILLQFYGLLLPYSLMSVGTPSPMTFLNSALVHTFAIYAISILTLFFAEQTQKAHHTTVEIRQDLRQLKELHLAVLQNMPVGVITLDCDGKVVFINSLAAPLLDGQVEVGATLSHLFELTLDKFSEGHVVTKNVADREVALLVRYTPLTHSNNLLGNIVTLQDVSPVQKMERELHNRERLASIGELAAGMAHEIRNPLASVRGSIEMLSRRTAKDQAEQGLMNIAIREIDRLNQLISDFLTYTRPQQLSLEMLDVAKIWQETIALLQTGLSSDFQVELKGSLPPLEGDGAKLRQVFWNLLRNAIEACQNVKRDHFLIACELSEVDQQAVIKISDNGQGISPEAMKGIFVPFFSTKSQGSGLGLAIIHRIVEGHHGSIDVTSVLGTGTAFTIRLPLKQPVNGGE